MAPMLLLISLAVFILGTSAEVPINCDEPICQPNLTPYCLLSGRTVYGHCELQTAVCEEDEIYDPEYTACNLLPYKINCANRDTCAKDNIRYCLRSGRSVYGHCGLQHAVCNEEEMWDPTYACLQLPYVINCANPDICAKDLTPYCMQSGRSVYGHCGLQKAVCNDTDRDMWDPDYMCQLPYPINCANPDVCTMDNTHYCMRSGRSVYGHCGLQEAMCRDGEMWDPTYTCLQLPYPINCANPDVCAEDLTHYCMQSGRSVYGHCGLQDAVCLGKDTWDPTDYCKTLPYVIDCDKPGCARDLHPYCMFSGKTVRGHCDLREAICKENESLNYRGPCVDVYEDK